MDLVSNTKTLIFDDNYSEIENLRKALDKLKIQNLYIKFDEEDEIEEADKFTNVRFIFADILVGTARTTIKNDVQAIATSITEHISDKNGAFILIIWSNHNDQLSKSLIEELEQENYNFFSITDIDKSKYTHSDESNVVKELITELKEKLQDNTEYFNLLRVWERDIHAATSETFNILLEDINNKEKTHSLLKNAISASAGKKHTTDDVEKRKGLWNTLNMILNDNVESTININHIKPEIVSTLNELDNDNDLITNELINRKLLFSNTYDSDLKMHPGNIFCFNSYENICENLRKNICGYKNEDSLIEEILNSDSLNQLVSKVKEEKTLSRKEASAFRLEVKSTFVPILLEFTPYCDFSQKGYKKARLIYGHIIPVQFRNLIMNNTKYIYMTPNFELERKIGNINPDKYFMSFNIKHIFAVNPDLLNNFSLLFRARKELVNDLQHDIASHVSRVGVTSL